MKVGSAVNSIYIVVTVWIPSIVFLLPNHTESKNKGFLLLAFLTLFVILHAVILQ